LGSDHHFVLLWIDDGEAQAALYDDEEQALRDAELVGGRVERRAVIAAPVEHRSGRFER